MYDRIKTSKPIFYRRLRMTDKLKTLVKSRRFWAAIGTVVVVVLNDTLGIPEDTANTIVAMGIAWIVGDSIRATE